MRLGSVFLFLLFSVAPVIGQEVSTGGLSGVWQDGEATRVWFFDWDAPPIRAGRLGFHVAPGAGAVGWDAFDGDLVWGGWTLSRASWSSTNIVASMPSPTVALRWNQEHFSLKFGSTEAALSLNHLGPWNVFFGAGRTAGVILSSWGGQEGSFHANAFGVRVGLPEFSLVYGRAEGGFSANFNLIVISPFRIDGDLGLNVAGFWSEKDWGFGDWSWGLGLGAGAAWATQKSWSVTREWVEPVFWPPPFFVNRTSLTTYTLETDPAWVVVLNPRVSWHSRSGFSLTARRWLPWSWGWRITNGSNAVSEPQQGTSDAISQTDSRNWWLAGLQVELAYHW